MSRDQRAIITIESRVNNIIPRMTDAYMPLDMQVINDNITKAFEKETGKKIPIEQLVLAGTKSKGFVASMSTLYDDFSGGTLLDGTVIPYGLDYNQIESFARAYSDDTMLVIAASQNVANIWQRALKGHKEAGLGYKVKILSK